MALIARGEKPSHQLKVHQKLIEGLRILSILADLIDSHLLSVSLSYEVIILDARWTRALKVASPSKTDEWNLVDSPSINSQ